MKLGCLSWFASGSNGEVARLAQSLHEAMGKRVATADRFRKLHIHNANQLYDYEVAEATATFEVGDCTF